MPFDHNLRELPIPRLGERILDKPLRILKEISDANGKPGDSPRFKNRKEELIRQLKRRKSAGESFERATDVVGRERLLLSIYTEYMGQADAKGWLPKLDDRIAESILGNSGKKWHRGRRRQVALLFFTHFDRISALPFLCNRLVEAYASADDSDSESVRAWHYHRKTIFDPAGPANIAKQSTETIRLPQLINRFSVPKEGCFAEKLRQAVLLGGISAAPFGKVTPIFAEVEKLRDERISSELLLGAAALKVMVQRVATEGRGKWSGDWPKWIVRFGCDPRYGRASETTAKWWGWATDSELRLAQKGVTGVTLGFFIHFLRNSLAGTKKASQFEFRSKFLIALLEAGKIQDARLVLNEASFYQLDRKYRSSASVARLIRTRDQTSMICLSCADDLHIIEGTHSFGLRVFHRRFPVAGFWKLPDKEYQDNDLRISPKKCPIFIRHGPSGSWVDTFFHKLRTEFHIEWNDIRI